MRGITVVVALNLVGEACLVGAGGGHNVDVVVPVSIGAEGNLADGRLGYRRICEDVRV